MARVGYAALISLALMRNVLAAYVIIPNENADLVQPISEDVMGALMQKGFKVKDVGRFDDSTRISVRFGGSCPEAMAPLKEIRSLSILKDRKQNIVCSEKLPDDGESRTDR